MRTAYRCDNLVFRSALHHKAGGAECDGPRDVSRVIVPSEHYDLGARRTIADALQRFQAIRVRHAYIEQDDVGLQIHRPLDRLISRGSFSYHLDVRTLQNGCYALSNY